MEVSMPDSRDELISRLMSGEQLGARSVAVILRVCRKTVQNMIKDGRLKTIPHPGGMVQVLDMSAVIRRLEEIEELENIGRYPWEK
jgi:hypothetical protein